MLIKKIQIIVKNINIFKSIQIILEKYENI